MAKQAAKEAGTVISTMTDAGGGNDGNTLSTSINGVAEKIIGQWHCPAIEAIETIHYTIRNCHETTAANQPDIFLFS